MILVTSDLMVCVETLKKEKSPGIRDYKTPSSAIE